MLHGSSRGGHGGGGTHRPPPPPPVEREFNCGDLSTKDTKEDGYIAGTAVGICVFSIALIVLSVQLYVAISEKTNNVAQLSLSMLFCAGVIAGLGYAIKHIKDTRHKARADAWPTTSAEKQTCASMINYKHYNGVATTTDDNVLQFTVPKNKVINRLKFKNLSGNVFKITIRKTVNGSVKELQIDAATDVLAEPGLTQSQYDAIYASDIYDEIVISSTSTFTARYEVHDIPAEMTEYINSRGIIGKKCSQTLLFVNPEHTVISEAKVYCEPL